jgi:hypothetical protein
MGNTPTGNAGDRDGSGRREKCTRGSEQCRNMAGDDEWDATAGAGVAVAKSLRQALRSPCMTTAPRHGTDKKDGDM